MVISYGPFCSVAKAAEIPGERWTLLVRRGVLLGSFCHTDLRRGLGCISLIALSRRAMRGARVGLLVAAAFGYVGCNDGTKASAAEPDSSVPDAASDTMTDLCGGRGADLGALMLESEQGRTWTLVEREPERTVVGDQSWVFEVSNEQGEPWQGVADQIVVTPFMPDHGHGTAVVVHVEEVASGKYRLVPVNLRMPGYWLITITAPASFADGGADELQFGVCVS